MAVRRKVRSVAFFAALLIAAIAGWQLAGWYIPTTQEEEQPFIVAEGSSMTSVAHRLEDQGFIDDAERFLLFAKLLGGNEPIKAGEFLIPVPAGGNQILSILQSDEVLRRYVTIPEGMPSVLIRERLRAKK